MRSPGAFNISRSARTLATLADGATSTRRYVSRFWKIGPENLVDTVTYSHGGKLVATMDSVPTVDQYTETSGTAGTADLTISDGVVFVDSGDPFIGQAATFDPSSRLRTISASFLVQK